MAARVHPEAALLPLPGREEAERGLVERAVLHNQGLEQARERVREALALRGIAASDRLPQLDATASFTKIETGDEAVAARLGKEVRESRNHAILQKARVWMSRRP